VFNVTNVYGFKNRRVCVFSASASDLNESLENIELKILLRIVHSLTIVLLLSQRFLFDSLNNLK